MKFLLIATALNLQMTYPSEEVCQKALEQVKQNDPTAMCIPAGEDRLDHTLDRFLNLVQNLQSQSVK